MSRLTVRAASISIRPALQSIDLDLGFGPNGFGAAEAARISYHRGERRNEVHGYGTRLSGALIDILRREIGDRLAGVINPVRSLERELSLATSALLREQVRIDEFSVNIIDGRVTIDLTDELGAQMRLSRAGNDLTLSAPSLPPERAQRLHEIFRREIPAISNAMSEVRLYVPRHLTGA
jgi:hypothetical protein